MPLKIAVTSYSFCKKKELLNELQKISKNLILNDKKDSLSEEETIKLLSSAELAIVGKEKITKKVLEQCPHLIGISKYGVGLDNIDQSALEEKNIHFFYEKGVNKTSVAEQTLGLMLTLIHNQYQSSESLKKGEWIRKGGFQLSNKTIGIIGVGNIGKELIRLLKPFSCRILVNDILDQKKYYQAQGAIECPKEKIFSDSDIITLHTPLTSLTKNLVNAHTLSLMKSSAFIINTARGGIIDQRALLDFIQNDCIAGAGLDVFENEPESNIELLSHPKIFCTPHIAGASHEATLLMGESALKGIKEFISD